MFNYGSRNLRGKPWIRGEDYVIGHTIQLNLRYVVPRS